MTQIKTSCGFEAEIDETAVNDMEFLEALDALQEGDLTGFAKISKLFLTEADRKKLYAMLKDERGRTPIDKAIAQITEILEQLNSKKK